MPYELTINPEGKELAQVDGSEGWLWRLDPEEFAQPPGTPTPFSEEIVKPALAENFASETEFLTRTEPYRHLYGGWRAPEEEVSGSAVVLQWNREEHHYFLAGPMRGGITEEVLLEMANSLRELEPLDIKDAPGNPAR
jgi:hypothetical protein